ncbi:MAG TPA: MFS transporter [Caulobacteraceae bacterium]|nr:MFS transporter [Caulobacteraceae bacterium]
MPQADAKRASARTPLPTILAFGAIQMPVLAIAVIYGVYLPPNYAGLGVGLAAVAAAITIVRGIDVFFDPILAMAMDRTRTPIGRYRPWVVLGTPIVMLGVWKILMPTGPVDEGYLILWLLVSFIGLSMMTLGTSAWSAVVATSYDDRARLFAWTSPMGILGIDALLMLPLFTHHKVAPGLTSSMPIIGTIFLVALPVGLAICAIFTPERLASAAQRPTFRLADYRAAIGRPTMLRLIGADFLLALGPGVTGPLYLFYFHAAKGFSVPDVSLMLIFYVTAGIVGGLFWGGYAAQRFGKHRALQIACVAYAITQSVLMAVPRVPPHYTLLDCMPTAAAMIAVGFTGTAFLILVRAMVADVVDEVRLERRQDLTSLLYSMVTTTTKLGGSITVAVVYPILAFVHFNPKEGAVNTPQAIFGLEMCYLFAPVVLVLIGGALFFGYKLDSRRHAEIRAALDLDVAAETLAGGIDPHPAPAVAAEAG